MRTASGSELGAVTETIEVRGQAALLETSTAAVGLNIKRRQIEAPPLLGRSPLMPTLPAPHVSAHTTTAGSLLDGRGTSHVSGTGRTAA